MNYLAVDIETCGLDSKVNPIIEFGGIWDDGGPTGGLSRFRALIVRRDRNYMINSYCVGMHQQLFKEIDAVDWDRLDDAAGYEVSSGVGGLSIVCELKDLGTWVRGWLDSIEALGKLNVAGKNFESFDSKWIRDPLLEAGVKLRRRVLDPAMLYVRKADEELPNLAECCKRAGIEYDPSEAHYALYDAMLVVKLLRAGGL